MMHSLMVALLLGAVPPIMAPAPATAARSALDVPIVAQAPERCGQAALEMVLRYYGADATALGEVGQAYDPVLRGSLITDLAAAARRAGYHASIETLGPDSLVSLLGEGVPPILLYQSGPSVVTVAHFGVVTGWDPAREAFTLNDGRSRPRRMDLADLGRRWRTAGSQALIIRRSSP